MNENENISKTLHELVFRYKIGIIFFIIFIFSQIFVIIYKIIYWGFGLFGIIIFVSFIYILIKDYIYLKGKLNIIIKSKRVDEDIINWYKKYQKKDEIPLKRLNNYKKQIKLLVKLWIAILICLGSFCVILLIFNKFEEYGFYFASGILLLLFFILFFKCFLYVWIKRPNY